MLTKPARFVAIAGGAFALAFGAGMALKRTTVPASSAAPTLAPAAAPQVVAPSLTSAIPRLRRNPRRSSTAGRAAPPPAATPPAAATPLAPRPVTPRPPPPPPPPPGDSKGRT